MRPRCKQRTTGAKGQAHLPRTGPSTKIIGVSPHAEKCCLSARRGGAVLHRSGLGETRGKRRKQLELLTTRRGTIPKPQPETAPATRTLRKWSQEESITMRASRVHVGTQCTAKLQSSSPRLGLPSSSTDTFKPLSHIAHQLRPATLKQWGQCRGNKVNWA